MLRSLSFRLSPYFRLREELSLSSLTYTNKVHPMCPFCKYDLKGVCNDEDCRLQHFRHCKPTKNEVLQDVGAYDPNLEKNAKDPDAVKENIVSFTVSFAKQYQEKMTWDELCVLLANHVKEHRKVAGLHSICHKARLWRPRQSDQNCSESEQEKAPDRGRGVVFSSKQNKCFLGKQTRCPVSSSTGHWHKEERYVCWEKMCCLVLGAARNPSLWFMSERLGLTECRRIFAPNSATYMWTRFFFRWLKARNKDPTSSWITPEPSNET